MGVTPKSIGTVNIVINLINDAIPRIRLKLHPMKKLAIILSIFPGILFVIALGSYLICSFLERDLPPGSANIGLGLLFLAALINIPTMVAWCIYFARKSGGGAQTADRGDVGKGKKGASVSAYLLSAVVIGILSSASVVIYTRMQYSPEESRVSSIEEWEKRSRLPGFTLLDRADLPGYYICVYDTGLGEIAFCYHQKKPEAAKRHSFAVFDSQGQNLQDPARWNKTTDLNRPGDTHYIPGMVVPIRPDHHGGIHIEFKADSGSGLKSIYQGRLSFDRSSEQGARQPATAPESKPEGDSQPKPESEERGASVGSPVAPHSPEVKPDISANSSFVIAPVFKNPGKESKILALNDQLKEGQTREQVEEILGRPLIGSDISNGSQQWYINEAERETFEGSPWGFGGICVFYDKQNCLVRAEVNYQYVQDRHMKSYLEKQSKKAKQGGAGQNATRPESK